MIVPYQIDDAYITYRYAAQINDGYGIVFNRGGESVEGYTSPAWLVLLVMAAKVLGNDMLPVAGSLLGIICLIISVILTVHLGRKSSEDNVFGVILSSLLLILLPPVLIYGATGLEPLLFVVLLLVYGGFLTGHLSWKWGSLIGFWAFWVRPEGAWLAVVVLVVWLMSGKNFREYFLDNRRYAGILAPLAGALILIGIRYALFGDIFPNTYYAKEPSIMTGLSYVYVQLTKPWGLTIFLTALWGAVTGNRYHRIYFVTGLSWCVATILEGGDWMPEGRLLLPALIFFVLSAGGNRVAFRKVRDYISPLLACAVTVSCVLACITVFKTAENTWNTVSWKEMLMAEWVELAGIKSVGTVDIGRFGYDNTDVEILDFAGLTDSYIGRCEGGHLTKKFDFSYIFDKRKPEAIILRVRKKPELSADGKLKKIFVVTRLEASILMSKAFNEKYRFLLAFVPDKFSSTYFGKAVFLRRDCNVDTKYVPAGRIITVGNRVKAEQ